MGDNLADVTVHIDETLDHSQLESVAEALRQSQGVSSVSSHDEKPHLIVVKYDPEQTTSQTIHKTVTDKGIHAELLGL